MKCFTYMYLVYDNEYRFICYIHVPSIWQWIQVYMLHQVCFMIHVSRFKIYKKLGGVSALLNGDISYICEHSSGNNTCCARRKETIVSEYNSIVSRYNSIVSRYNSIVYSMNNNNTLIIFIHQLPAIKTFPILLRLLYRLYWATQYTKFVEQTREESHVSTAIHT